MKKTMIGLYLLLGLLGLGMLYLAWIFSLPPEAFDLKGDRLFSDMVVLVSVPQSVYLAMCLLITIILILAATYPFRQRRRFRQTFGYNATSRYDWKTRTILQLVVDAKLLSLARDFLDACTQEEQLTAGSKIKQTFGSVTEHAEVLQVAQAQLRKLNAARSTVEKTKKAFWSAYPLAKNFFFTVRPKVNDYVKLAKAVTKSTTAIAKATA